MQCALFSKNGVVAMHVAQGAQARAFSAPFVQLINAYRCYTLGDAYLVYRFALSSGRHTEPFLNQKTRKV